ncbi:MAG: protein kinase [Candidatus Brocadiia bacterium]
MRVHCPDCRTPFDVPPDSDEVECPHCGNGFSVVAEAPTLTHGPAAQPESTDSSAGTGPRIRIYCPECRKELTLPRGQPYGNCPACGADLEADQADETVTAADDDLHTARTMPTARTAATQGYDEPAEEAREWLEIHLADKYQIREFVARGGMGAIYKARQLQPSRDVALKVMLSGAFASPAQRKRFEREAQAIAQLNHPAIVPVYEYGEVGGQPYFTMEYVEGLDLATFCHVNDLGRHEVARLMVRVCDAVHYAHEHGVIHRDLKPGNIIVDEMRRPRILDFGLSRPTADSAEQFSMLTATGDFLGTPRYMAPEQTIGRPEAVDRRTDIYALGVMLYELLCGILPYPLDHARGLEVFELIRHAEPIRPGALHENFSRDLEIILLKAIEKEKERRYQTAEALAEDLENFLADRPINARPATLGYRLRKWGWRNRRVLTPVFISGVILVVLVGIFSGRIARLVERVRDLGRSVETRESELKGFLAGAESGRARVEELIDSGEWQRALFGAEFFAENLPDEAGVGDLPLLVRRRAEDAVAEQLGEFQAALRNQDYETARTYAEELAGLSAALPAQFDELRSRAAGPAEDYAGRCWRDLRAAVERSYTPEDATARIRQFLHALPQNPHEEEARQLLEEMQEKTPEFYLARHEDATLRALQSYQWETAADVLRSAGQLLDQNEVPEATDWRRRFGELRARLNSVIRADTVNQLALLRRLEAHGAFLKDLVFSADGDRLVSVALQSPAKVWNTEDWSVVHSLEYEGEASAGALSPDGNTLALGTREGRIMLWSLADGELLTSLRGDGGRVKDLMFLPRGDTLIASHRTAVSAWNVSSGTALEEPTFPGQAPAALSPDGRVLAAAQGEAGIAFWNNETGRREQLLEVAGPRLVEFSPDGSTLAVIHRPEDSEQPVGRLWDVGSESWQAEFTPSRVRVLTMLFSPDGRMLATVTGGVEQKFVAFWSVPDGRDLGRLELDDTPWTAAIRPDCRQLVVGHNNGRISVWGLPGGANEGAAVERTDR